MNRYQSLLKWLENGKMYFFNIFNIYSSYIVVCVTVGKTFCTNILFFVTKKQQNKLKMNIQYVFLNLCCKTNREREWQRERDGQREGGGREGEHWKHRTPLAVTTWLTWVQHAQRLWPSIDCLFVERFKDKKSARLQICQWFAVFALYPQTVLPTKDISMHQTSFLIGLMNDPSLLWGRFTQISL